MSYLANDVLNHAIELINYFDFFRNNDFSFDEDAVKSSLKPHKIKVCVCVSILKLGYSHCIARHFVSIIAAYILQALRVN